MGPDKDLISSDKAFVAVMDTLTVGYIKWCADRKPSTAGWASSLTGSSPRPQELDDLDSENWEVGDNGDRIDPWQLTNLLVLVSADEPYDPFTFSTSSQGGRSAIADLCEAHGDDRRRRRYPVVLLETDPTASDRMSGSIKVPVLKIIDAVDVQPVQRPDRWDPRRRALIPTLAAIAPPRRQWRGGRRRLPTPRRRKAIRATIRAMLSKGMCPSEGEHMGLPGVQSARQA